MTAFLQRKEATGEPGQSVHSARQVGSAAVSAGPPDTGAGARGPAHTVSGGPSGSVARQPHPRPPAVSQQRPAAQRMLQLGQTSKPTASPASLPAARQPRNGGPGRSTAGNQLPAPAPAPTAVTPTAPNPFRVDVVRQVQGANAAGPSGAVSAVQGPGGGGVHRVKEEVALEVWGLAHPGDPEAAHGRYQRILGSLPPPAVDTCGGHSGARALPELGAQLHAPAAAAAAAPAAALGNGANAAAAALFPRTAAGPNAPPVAAAVVQSSFCGRAPPAAAAAAAGQAQAGSAGAAPWGAGPADAGALPAVMRMRLNDEQLRAAISEPDRPLLIVAGAGTGKTSTLIARIVHLIAGERIDPRLILVITFTNKAATEVRERLERAGISPRGLTAATFHSFCFSIVRFYYKFAGFSQCPTVWTDTDLKRAVALAMRLESLERGKVDMAAWMGLPESASWQDILLSVQAKNPEIWESCTEAAKELEAKQQKRKRKKQADEGGKGAANGPAGKKGAKKPRHEGTGRAPSASAAGPQRSVAGEPSHAAASEAGPADTAATGGDGGDDGTREAAFAAGANNRLLFRAELLKLMYEKLQQKYAPGTEKVVGAKPTAKQINYMLQFVDQLKRAGGDISDYPGRAKFYTYYEAMLRAANAIDFNDMLLLVDKLINDHAWILDRLQRRHQYILVDEYQDCSLQQVGFVDKLSGGHGRLTAVGDDAQSIYRFRGAMPNVFQVFRQHHNQGLQQTLLESNYRSRPKILAVGQAVLEGSTSVTRKVLRATKPDTPDKVTFIEAGTPADEAEAIAQQVQELIQEGSGLGPGDVAVLYRCFKYGGAKTHMPLQTALRSRGIPFVLVRDKSVFERKEVQDTLAYLRLAVNPADDTAFLRIYNTPPRRLGEAKAAFMSTLQDLQESLDRQRQEHERAGAASQPDWRHHAAAAAAGRQQQRPGEMPEDDGPAAGRPGAAAQRPPEHSLYGLCCALLQDAGGVGSGEVDLMGHQLAPAHRAGAEKLVQVVEDLRRSVWQLGPAGAIKRVLDLTGYVEWLADKKATKERVAQDAAQELAMSPGGAARAARAQAARAVDAQDSEMDSEEDEEEQEADAAAAGVQAGNATPGAQATTGRGGGEEGSDEDSEEGEEGEGDDELPPLPAGLPPEPQDLEERARKMLGLKMLFREAKLFASKWQVPSKAFPLPVPSGSGAAASAAGSASDPSSPQPPGLGAPELFTLAAHAVMSALNGEQVQAALRRAHPVTGLPCVTPEVLEQMYAEQRRGPLVMRDFLAHVALSDREVEAGGAGAAAGRGGAKARRAVTISTIHAAKGLEFPVVFVARWADGYLPTVARPDRQELERMTAEEQLEYMQKDAEEHREEEQRLAHVAVTRAMERLFITSIRVHRVQGKAMLVAPSSIRLPTDERLVEVRRLPKSAEEEDLEEAARRRGEAMQG